jgi:1-acyl-sn-glycerol-3-phosphate acyltransferase
MRGLGVTVSIVGTFPDYGALIANHSSYLDIVTLASLHPCVFCAKAEIRKWPVLGWITTMIGTVFVARGRGNSAIEAKAEMQAAVEAGVPVVFFPEGTTTNGLDLLPFHSGLLAQMLAVNAPITAAYLRYVLTANNGPGISVENDVCWWGTRPMLRHIVRFLGLRGVDVEVRFAPGAIPFASDLGHRKQAAVESRNAVLQLATEAGHPLREPAAMPRR